MPDTSPSAPHPRSAARVKTAGPLDGEVIPPAIRSVKPERDTPTTPEAPRVGLRLSTALLAGALVATLSGAGALEGYRWHLHRTNVAATGPSPTAVALARVSKDLGDLKVVVSAIRTDESDKALRKTVDQLKAELDGVRAANATAMAQLAARLDKAAAGPAMGDVMARLDKLDHDSRLSDITSRLDRIEHQVSSQAPTGSIAPQARASAGQSIVAQASASLPATVQSAKQARSAVLDNWIVRDVYSGIALVEGRSGSIREVIPGETLPGAGEVRSIQRRGRGWIVVTSRGIIDTETW